MRKQSLFLTVAILCLVATLCLPLVHFEPATMGLGRIMNVLFITDGETNISLTPVPLLLLLSLACPVCLWAIFAKKALLANPKAKVADRKKQSLLCKAALAILLLWYAVAAAVIYIEKGADTIRPQFALILPLIAIILVLMANAGIKADDRLVRSADRIR